MFLDKRLMVNADVYYYDYKGFQISNLVACGHAGQPACDNVGKPFNLTILNVPATVEGAELETQYMFTDNDDVSLSMSYMHSKINGDVILLIPPVTHIAISGDALPNSPQFSLTGNYSHKFDFDGVGTFTPNFTVRYSSSSYVTIPKSVYSTQSAYWTEDFLLTYDPPKGKWGISAYVRNLSDEVVKSNYVGNAMTLNTPRTYGLMLNTHF